MFCDFIPTESYQPYLPPPPSAATSAQHASTSESDELKSQLKRLERLIAALQNAPEPLRRKIAAAARTHAPKKPEPVIDVETADLCVP
jgi:hypothetical protein